MKRILDKKVGVRFPYFPRFQTLISSLHTSTHYIENSGRDKGVCLVLLLIVYFPLKTEALMGAPYDKNRAQNTGCWRITGLPGILLV